MSDIRERIESEISEIKKNGSDLFILESQFLNFNIPHRLDSFSTFFDYSDYYILGTVNHFNQRANIKLTVLDMFTSIDLEIELVGHTHLNVYIDPKTRQFEGESFGFRFKDWQIINYNLDSYYENI